MNFKSIKNGFKLTTVALMITSIVGCTNNKVKLTVFDKSMNNPAAITDGLVMVNRDGERFEYKKNENKELISIKKISLYYDYHTCHSLARSDYSDVVKQVTYFSKTIYSFEQDDKTYLKTKNFKVEMINCQSNLDLLDSNSKISFLYQKAYHYEIKVENADISNDVVERNPKKSYAEETFGSVGQYVVIPFVVVGVIILSPFYVIQYISK